MCGYEEEMKTYQEIMALDWVHVTSKERLLLHKAASTIKALVEDELPSVQAGDLPLDEGWHWVLDEGVDGPAWSMWYVTRAVFGGKMQFAMADKKLSGDDLMPCEPGKYIRVIEPDMPKEWKTQAPTPRS